MKTQRRQREKAMEDRGGDWSDAVTSPGHQGGLAATGTGRGRKESHLEPSELGAGPR